jgi:hypothetical protein
MRTSCKAALRLAVVLAALAASTVHGQSRNLAPGFTQRPSASKLVVVSPDLELFSISAGGVREPKADWTEAAQQHFKAALAARRSQLGAQARDLSERDMDELAEINGLHGAVAQSVFLHHVMGMKLPTKNDQLDWSMGDAVRPLRERTGADYALFFWVRDSYASAERKAAMVAMALLGVGLAGGSQVGYASLVDLRDGRIVWYNDVRRASGDLREAQPALETVEALLKNFPPLQ